jgi:hypothetical protein
MLRFERKINGPFSKTSLIIPNYVLKRFIHFRVDEIFGIWELGRVPAWRDLRLKQIGPLMTIRCRYLRFS